MGCNIHIYDTDYKIENRKMDYAVYGTWFCLEAIWMLVLYFDYTPASKKRVYTTSLPLSFCPKQKVL